MKKFPLACALAFAASVSPAMADDAPPVSQAAQQQAVQPMRDITSLALSKEMSPGWNLGNALEATPDETSWGNAPASQKLMDAVRAAGFRTVRIPVSWTAHADAHFTIDRAWMKRVTEVVDYALKAGLYVVVNVHWDGGWLQPTHANQAEANAHLARLWTQIVDNFRDYDDHLLFAGTNEVMVTGDYAPPTDEYAGVQNGFNQVFVDTVRASGGNNARRHLVVQGYNTNIDNTVARFRLPADTVPDRLMVEVHDYDPYDFTLNEKSDIWQWGAIAIDPSAMEAWANEAHVDAQFQKMKEHFIDKGIPVILGEYAATPHIGRKGAIRYAAYWDYYMTRSAHQHGLVPVFWDSGALVHGSGLFDRKTGKPYLPDVVGLIVKAGQ